MPETVAIADLGPCTAALSLAMRALPALRTWGGGPEHQAEIDQAIAATRGALLTVATTNALPIDQAATLNTLLHQASWHALQASLGTSRYQPGVVSALQSAQHILRLSAGRWYPDDHEDTPADHVAPMLQYAARAGAVLLDDQAVAATFSADERSHLAASSASALQRLASPTRRRVLASMR